MRVARPSCIPLLSWGTRPGADWVRGTSRSWLQVPLCTGGFWSQHCQRLSRQLWPGISILSLCFYPLILQASQVWGVFPVQCTELHQITNKQSVTIHIALFFPWLHTELLYYLMFLHLVNPSSFLSTGPQTSTPTCPSSHCGSPELLPGTVWQ